MKSTYTKNRTRARGARPDKVRSRRTLVSATTVDASPLPKTTTVHRLYLVAIFLSAFLLFQVQPLVSKAILPWFGGTPSVWTACMLFFQILLFLGYLYAHLVSTYLKPVALAITHTCVIVAAVLMLPVLPDAAWKPSAGGVPMLQILTLLTVCVGLPFFLLSSSAPLIQMWWQRTGGGQPYRLYAMQAKSDVADRHIGVVGLGVGTMAAYARDGDQYRFYEINPHVITLAHNLFDYLEHATNLGAQVKVVEGDARLSLEEEVDQQFDVLVLDAFSSDSVPVHLLTVEAFQEYMRHMKEDGIIAMHISNHYLNMVPLGAALAREHNLDWRAVVRRKPVGKQGSRWLLFARSGVLENVDGRENVISTRDVPRIDAWTDNYSNLLRLLR